MSSPCDENIGEKESSFSCASGGMGSKKLRRVGLSQELCDRLNRHQIVTCQDFLCLSPLELMKMTGLSYQAVHELLCVVSRACAPQMQTAYEIKTQRCAAHSSAFLSTTLPALDEALHGGVACGSLTEVKKTLSKPSNIDLEPSEPGEKV
uniref:RAD51 paralog B n=1 Tax=Ovis aries TaxID=9940 RepID=A0AC11EAL5_SHEEP